MEETIFGSSESIVYQAADWIKLVVEVLGVAIIAWGVVFSLLCYGRQLFGSADGDYIPLRLSLARYLVVALEFQLAADILGTAIAPDWNAIGKLAAIAVIRTVLNHFLMLEMEKEIEMQEKGVKDKLNDRDSDVDAVVSVE
ncbi:DUF1622 domain-containing protein [Lewinella sp. 4G2]|uniref:DUF1622 domain-containing protein n=1 Tax=Lewinella sp. 4G2 TaxID=1803372 RepID=UPI0007B4BF45|nr:DUF1622 domain-containing protein [Lewinella sp. 4G2]OAV44802.1 hypothetical protein A3850_010010 [Lewinella sp. 4G2]